MSGTISNPGFLIDLDGLLINSEGISEIAFEKMCSQLGCDFTKDYHSKIRGTKKQFWSKTFVDTFGLQLEPDEVANLHTRLLLEELDQSVQLMPGASDLLGWISLRAYPKALVTSSDSSYATKYLSKLGILAQFDEIVASEDVSNGKPDPEPFLLGASRIKRKPSQCFVFEDSVNGVISGKTAGATVFGVPTNESDKNRMNTADYILSSLDKSIPILEELGL
ncbi:MAG: HAD family phosphatase [Patescibacteria group bacterium]